MAAIFECGMLNEIFFLLFALSHAYYKAKFGTFTGSKANLRLLQHCIIRSNFIVLVENLNKI